MGGFEKQFSLGDSLRYAAGYIVTNHDDYVKVDVRNPWKEKELLNSYILVPRDKPLPKNLPKGTIVRVPIRNIVVYTTVHSAFLDALEATDDIIGVCEAQYIKVSSITERIEKGYIKNLGQATSPNVERMIEIGAEVVIASPFNNSSYGPVEKIGIPIIECADYMENNPLGSAEWLKFLGLFTGRVAIADSLFSETEANYLRLKALVANTEYRPKLMTGMKYGSTWYVPSGESFMANIYRDAGAGYLFNYLPGAGGAPLSFETILEKAIHADIWLINYNRENEMTYNDLYSDYSPYSRFDAFRDRRIYGGNTNYSLYYEEVPLHPDYLLSELISIFHPQLLSGHKPRYFVPLKE